MPTDYSNPNYAPHLALGQLGEELAGNWLVRNGYRLLERNWRSRHHQEIDLIAFRDNRLHCVEVKTRSHQGAFDPRYAIDHDKLLALARAMNLYKQQKRLDFNVTYDAIIIFLRSEDDYDLQFIPDIQ